MVEFSKIEKVDLKNIRVRARATPLRVKIESLMPGEAITVTGVERNSIEGVQGALRGEGRMFTVQKLDLLKYRVIRLK